MVKQSSHYSESDIGNSPFLRLADKQRAYSVESSSHGGAHLRVLQLKVGSDKDTCDTFSKSKP